MCQKIFSSGSEEHTKDIRKKRLPVKWAMLYLEKNE